MVRRRIVWSLLAQEQRKSIFNYWNKRNKSKEYSKKLNSLIVQAINLISIFPEIGINTEFRNIKMKLVRDYYIVYSYTNSELNILCIWDVRQKPNKLRKILQ